MYQLLTDSACDLPHQLLEEAGVAFVSMHVDIAGTEMIDDLGRQFDLPHFYAQIAQGVMPTTAQVNVGQFVDFFTPYVEAETPILYLSFSSGLSGTNASAHQAKAVILENHPDAVIHIVDSLAAASGEGLLVLEAIDRQQAGATIDELTTWLAQNRLRLRSWFTVDDLNYLYHGGRVSKTSAALGTMLRIKPVMDVDPTGHLRLVRKVRSRQRSIEALAQETLTAIAGHQAQRVLITNSQAQTDAEQIGALIQEAAPDAQLMYTDLGPTITSHTGLGCLAVFSLAATDRQ